MIWLDKACIDQQNVEASLAGLPVCLSGCKSMVVLAGKSYVTRLWCVLEVFTFLRIGGSMDRLQAIPINESAEVHSLFAAFDAQNASCYNKSDRQHLLGVIESACGDLVYFNRLFRDTFQSRLRRISMMMDNKHVLTA